MKNFTRLKKEWRQISILLLSFICFSGLGGCTDNTIDVDPPSYRPSNPKKPVTFTEFTPNEGSIGTRMFISGSNFGTDISLIHVTIGGKPARVLSSNGTQIYCLVPTRADGGYIEIEIDNPEGEDIKYTFDKKFSYLYNTAVSTLCGVVDRDGNASITDGGFDVAGFNTMGQLSFDATNGDRDIYIFEGSQTLRKIDLNTETVSTVTTKSNVNWSYANAMVWSNDRDTLFTNNVDDRSEYAPGIFYFLRKEKFSVGYNGVTARGINTIFKHPKDDGVFLIRGSNATYYKTLYEPNMQTWVVDTLGAFGNNAQWYQCAVFHPSGDFAYCISRDKHCIQKATYNNTTNRLENPNVFVGSAGSAGYYDGPGTEARFRVPIQGCFVKNEEYEKEGKADIYDFYVTDNGNHCIRKITPDGIVTTFAGRGSWSSDQIVSGYIDGDLRKTARFKNPLGICYDEATATFYISDVGNHRIRTIAVQ